VAARYFDRSVTTTETVVRHRRRLDGELTKICEEWSINDTSANSSRGKATARAPWPRAVFAITALYMVEEQADRLLWERQAAAGQGYRSGPSPYRC